MSRYSGDTGYIIQGHGYIIRNAGSSVSIHRPDGAIVEADSVPAALDYVEAQRNAGPLIRCPDCDPESCPCVIA